MTRPGAGERATAVGLVAMALAGGAESALAQSAYQKPPKEVLEILNAPAPPVVVLNPTRDTLLIIETARYPSIADLARPVLRLAGQRINPRTNGLHLSARVTGLTILPIEGGRPRPVALPAGTVGYPEWSPDGKRFAVTVTGDDRIELWVGDTESAKLKQVPGVVLSGAFGDPVDWIPDGKSLLCRLIPAGRGMPPVVPPTPPGPTIQESDGQAAPVRTFQDLLQNAHDEDLFDYYATSQLAVVTLEGNARPIGKPAVFASVSLSPRGDYFLVNRVHRPYSYLLPAFAFPRAIEVWAEAGVLVRRFADLPLQDKVPIEGVPTGPRSVQWVPTEAATLLWVEALDGGDPRKKVLHRDQIVLTKGEGAEWINPRPFKIEHRFSGIQFFRHGSAALVTEYDRDRRWARTTRRIVSVDGARDKNDAGIVVFDRSIQDRYNDPGTPLTKRLRNGHSVLWGEVDADRPAEPTGSTKVFLTGPGASPKGDRPFLDRYDIASKKKERLFQSGDGEYASATPLTDDASKLLVRRESPTEPGNYYLRTGAKETPLTTFHDPTPQLRKIKKELVTTKRPDGVTISFTLYLPPDYKGGEKRPTVFWAYPREFNDAGTAGQVVGSANRFTTFTGPSHLFFLTQGYVVMDEVSIPIVGPPETANDTYVEQLVSSAKAAIDKAVELGPVDRDRIGVGGHSYGAFMTANLLAHSDLFRAGIARSGAYNRTLTPFGFQNERRTFWEAPGVYGKMSPFYAADKIRAPILLIHGAADNNPGTFPVQSERLYQAVRGTGGTARLVLLPHEAHGYAARESIEHVLYEQIAWFDQYVKNAKPRSDGK
jgi:dipeptidyl aminopeptidase/acylaminoacyl peptidase